jgi:FixJ family two-component response regulator
LPLNPPIIHIVDDDAFVRQALQRLLATEPSFEVRNHPSALSFLDTLDPQAHGCVLLDLAMPGLDGLAVQHILGQRGCTLPTLFLTATREQPLREAALRGGAVDVLHKPIDADLLLSAVQRALSRDLLRRVRVATQALAIRTDSPP